MNAKPSWVNDQNLAILVIVLWILPFAVYLFNTPEPSILRMSKPFVYSVVWWIVALGIFVLWGYYDLKGGK